MEIIEGENTIAATDAEEWRVWLRDHHQSKTPVWLIIYHKQSGVPSVYYEEAVEEALCFGWIDSKPNKRDEKSYYLFFAPRHAKSNWSRANRERVERLQEEGKMAPAGLRRVKEAKETGTWTALIDVENNVIPADLQAALDRDPQASKHFKDFPPSSKRIILEWILNAKRPATRDKRIRETVEKAARNIRANHYR